jgi:hypothetical protein
VQGSSIAIGVLALLAGLAIAALDFAVYRAGPVQAVGFVWTSVVAILLTIMCALPYLLIKQRGAQKRNYAGAQMLLLTGVLMLILTQVPGASRFGGISESAKQRHIEFISPFKTYIWGIAALLAVAGLAAFAWERSYGLEHEEAER